MTVETFSVCVTPQIAALDDLLDTVYRMAWYVAPYGDLVSALTVPVDPALLARIPDVRAFLAQNRPSYVAAQAMDFVRSLGQRLVFVASGSDAYFEAATRARIFMIWNEPLHEAGMALPLRMGMMNKRRVSIDRNCNPYEDFQVCEALQSQSPWGLADWQLGQQRWQRFAAWVKGLGLNKVYVVGTGPNLTLSAEHDFSDGVAVVVSSLLKNPVWLERLSPRLVCVVDAIYQLGFTTYAAEVREGIVAAMRQLPDLHLLTRIHYSRLIRACLPPDLEDRIITCPMVRSVPFNADLSEQFYAFDNPNVLTMAMLPAASTLAPRLVLAGCDGSPAPTKTVWDYAAGLNLVREMEVLDIAYPAVRQRDNAAYLAEHSRQVAETIEGVEAAGRTVTSLTPSHIPAIQARFSPKARSSGS